MIEGLIAKLTFRTVSIIALALLFAGLLIWGPQACNSYFAAKKETRVVKGQAEASMQAGEIAVGKAGENAAKAEQIDVTVEEAKNEIRNAPDGFSNNAALRASCRLRSYYDSEQCAALRKADSARVESGRSAGSNTNR